MNPLSLTELAGEVITQIKDPDKAISFIEKIAPKVADNHEAKVLCSVLIAQVKLRIKTMFVPCINHTNLKERYF